MNDAAPEKLAIPPLRSGGILLGYGCNLRCRHCNYRSGPDVAEWMAESVLEQAMDMLARERRLVDIHIGGGEPMLRPDLAIRAVRAAADRKIRLTYIETNGFFADTAEKAAEAFRPLRDAGLKAVLISVSPYHNEGLPLAKTTNCIEAAMDVFGQDGVFPWLGHFLPMLSRLDPGRVHPLEEFLDANGLKPGDRRLLRLFPLTPGGRAPERLGDFFPRQPAASFRNGHCLDMLTDVTHFHIDPHGSLFTGHCPGIVSGTVDNPHGEKAADRHPVFAALAFGGPHALMELAERECGFKPGPDGYASPCHLCFQVRQALVRADARAWPELRPLSYYRG